MASARTTAFIGFGEAGATFAEQWRLGRICAYDIKTDDPATAVAKRLEYDRLGVKGAATLEQALSEADLIISIVTADQALAAAGAAAKVIGEGAVYCDFNSVAPHTKLQAAQFIESAGGYYADVAVLGPVCPAGLEVPLLVSGVQAEDACALLTETGFKPRRIDGPAGRASTIKMLRSVMVKGIEALTAECFLAAHRAGVIQEVAESLDGNGTDVSWAEKADYNLDRMLVHGLRRAAEMDEVAGTLQSLGIDSEMVQAAAVKQRAIGDILLLGERPPAGLAGKAALILDKAKPA